MKWNRPTIRVCLISLNKHNNFYNIYLARRDFWLLPMVNVTCHFLLFFSLPAGSLKMFLSFPWRISNVIGPSSSGSRTLSRGIGFTFRPTCSSYLDTTSWSSCTVKACLILELTFSADISTTMVSSGWTLGPSLSLMAARRAAGTRLGKGLLVSEGRLLDVWMVPSFPGCGPNVESVFRLSSKRSQLLERFEIVLNWVSLAYWVVWVMSGKMGIWLSSSLVSDKSVKSLEKD